MQKSSPFSNQIPLETHGALHSSAGGWDDHAESGAGAGPGEAAGSYRRPLKNMVKYGEIWETHYKYL